MAAVQPTGSTPPARIHLCPTVGSIAVQGNRRTNDAVIRRELLFQVGSPYDSSLVEESARNLRMLLYLANIQITARPRCESPGGESPCADAGRSPAVVDVVVRVEDRYSRALSPLVAGAAQELSYGLAAMDYNFLGQGHTARMTLERDAVSGHYGALSYRVPRLRDSRCVLDTDLGFGAEGHHAELRISRPFFSLAAVKAFGLSMSSSESVRRLYADGRPTAQYRRTYRGASAWVTRSLGSQVKLRPGLRISLSERHYHTSRGYTYAPADSRRVIPSISLLVWRPHYERARYLHALGNIEDVQVGSWISVGAGASLRALGSDRDFPFFALQIAPRLKPSSHTYAFLLFLASTRYHSGECRQLTTTSQIRLYKQIASVHGLAARLRLDSIDRPETESQFLLGVDTGLRGYSARSMAGRRRLTVSFEARPTFRQRPDYTIAGAAFADAGTAWTPGRSSLSIRPALGLGLRLGLPRVYSAPVMRADVARGLRHGVWQLCFGVGQFF